jgi:hypothetical protein
VLIVDNGRAVEQGDRAALAADGASRLSGLLRTGAGTVPA